MLKTTGEWFAAAIYNPNPNTTLHKQIGNKHAPNNMSVISYVVNADSGR